jgi:hypothetical protein
MSDQTQELYYDSSVIKDVFHFQWALFESATGIYEAFNKRASVRRIMGLSLFSSISYVVTLALVIGDNPYIPLGNNLRYFPFDLAFMFLIWVSFLVQAVVQFGCFRLIRGKGDLVAQGYLNALFSANIILLLWLAILAVSITRAKGIDSILVILGGFYLLMPSILYLKAIHRVSIGRIAVGFILAGVASIPVYLGYLALFNFLREAQPYEHGNVRLWLVFVILAAAAVASVAYMYQEEMRREAST